MFNEIKAGVDLSDVRHRLTLDPHNTPPDGVLCRCTHSTQTYHVVHNSHSRYIAAHALTQVAMRGTRDVDPRSSTLLAPRREEQDCSRLVHDARGRARRAVSHLGVGGVCVGLSVGVSA